MSYDRRSAVQTDEKELQGCLKSIRSLLKQAKEWEGEAETAVTEMERASAKKQFGKDFDWNAATAKVMSFAYQGKEIQGQAEEIRGILRRLRTSTK